MLANIYGEEEELLDYVDPEVQERRDLCRNLDNSNIQGNIGELNVAAYLLLRNHVVSFALGGTAGLDLIVIIKDHTIDGMKKVSIQVKSSIEPVKNLVRAKRTEGEKRQFHTQTPHYKFDTHKKIGRSGRRRKLTKDDCDIVAFVCLDTGSIDFLKVSELTGVDIRLYLTNHRRGNKTNVIGTRRFELLFDKVENA